MCVLDAHSETFPKSNMVSRARARVSTGGGAVTGSGATAARGVSVQARRGPCAGAARHAYGRRAQQGPREAYVRAYQGACGAREPAHGRGGGAARGLRLRACMLGAHAGLAEVAG